MAYYGYPATTYGSYGALSSGYSYPAGYTTPLTGLPYGYGLPAQYSVPIASQYAFQPTSVFGASSFGAPAAQQGPGIKLTYFDFAGRAEAIRLALFIAGIPFEDERVSRDDWNARKEAGTARFGQVPLLEVNGRQLAQSYAQLMFVGEMAGLYPTDPWERAKVNEALFLSEDWIQSLVPSLREQDADKKKELRAKFVSELPKFVGYIDKLLTESNTGFVAGNRLSIADLAFYVLFEWFAGGSVDDVPADFLKDSPRVLEFRDRIHNLPRIQQWRAQQEDRKKDKEAKAAAAAAAAAATTETPQQA